MALQLNPISTVLLGKCSLPAIEADTKRWWPICQLWVSSGHPAMVSDKSAHSLFPDIPNSGPLYPHMARC